MLLAFQQQQATSNRSNPPYKYIHLTTARLRLTVTATTDDDFDTPPGGPVHADDVEGARGSCATGQVETLRRRWVWVCTGWWWWKRRQFQPTGFSDEQHRLYGDAVESIWERDGRPLGGLVVDGSMDRWADSLLVDSSST